MSFGFGGNNNNSTTFGGFGSSNTGGGSGFGANTNTTSGGSLFGGNTATSGGFGGFGANTNNNNTSNSPFGASKSTFGATATTSSGGGMFGNTTSTSGGFGGGTGTFGNTSNTGTGFGGSNTGGGLFGANKPATGGFGSTNTGSSMFGGGSNTTGGFGNTASTTPNNPFSTNTTNTGFGASNTNTGSGFGSTNTGGAAFGGFGASNTAAASNNNQGTAAVPFNAFQEKEGQSNASVAYQSLTFQDPYKNKTFEELRVEDYAQGRRYGNTNGQAGSFGQSTGFGGFGQTNTNTGTGGSSLFGNQPQNTTTGSSTFGGFGNNTNTNANTNTANPFGSSTTGGGMFGANKPAGSSLFGNNNATPGTTTGGFGSTATTGGGLFGNQQNQQQPQQNNPFGSSTANTGGSLFGNNQNQQQNNNAFGSTSNTGGGLFGAQTQPQQNKPAFGGFGASTNTGGTFGGNTNTGGGLFGAQNNQQQPQNNPFGPSTNHTGSSLFGNQNKPAGGGMFGSSTTNNNTGGGLFGNQTQGNTGGGLFGNQNQNKPTGTGMFGSSTNTGTTGTGLFGSTQNQNQNQGSSLFGGGGNTGGSSLFGNSQNKPGGLFGGNNTSNAGTSLFGGQQNQTQNTGGSLFGGSLGGGQQNQQNAGSSLFGSTNQQQQQPNQLHASLTGAPYGNEQLFSSLAAPSPPVGPLATPLQHARPAPKKTPSLMASMRLNTPVYSPRASGSLGRTGGYGFTYSTYGTPGSAFAGSLTPGASSMLRPTGSFGSALAGRLNKSISMGNLRGDGTPGEGRPSLLRESALSPPGSMSRYGSGSVRKLNIDRSLRTDLFAPRAEETAKRGVSFDRTADQSQERRREPQPSAENALIRTEEDSEPEQSPGLIRAAPQPNGGGRPQEMTQVNGKNGSLSTVPEDGVAPQRPGSAPATQQKPGPSRSSRGAEPGEYWTKPSLDQLNSMSRTQLQHVGKFTVGRENVGHVEFSSCDLTSTNFEDICGNIVRLTPRTLTVYEDNADKPPMGNALNVPSKVWLEQSFPKSHGGKKNVFAKEGPIYDKHINRLKRIGGTTFVSFDADTGVWHFTVEHFTTYGLDDEDENEDVTQQGESSGLSEAPETPGQEEEEETMQSIETGTGEMDDTFQFKLDRRSQLSVPGGFDEPDVSYDYDDPSADEGMDTEHEEHDETEMEDPFTSSGGGAVQPPSPGAIERYHSSMMEEDEPTGDVDMPEEEEEQPSPEMPGAFAPEPKMPRSILKPSTGRSVFASPEKLATETWEEQLQRTISPKKRDRQALRNMQQSIMKAKEQGEVIESPFKQSLFGQSAMGQSAMGQSAFGQSYLATKSAKKGKAGVSTLGVSNNQLGKSQAFLTSMDIMDSIMEEERRSKRTIAGRTGFEYPYPKKARLSTSDDLSEQDGAFHDCLKPSFAADGTLVYAASGSAPQTSGMLAPSMQALVAEHKDVRFAKIVPGKDLVTGTLGVQKEITTIKRPEGSVPSATTGAEVIFQGYAQEAKSSMSESPSSVEQQELALWELCSLLFDPVGLTCQIYKLDMPQHLIAKYTPQLQLDAFKAFWAKQVATMVDDGLKRAKTAEEKALLLLTKNDVAGACDVLVAAKDFRLATLVAQLPGSQTTRGMMKGQIEAWRKRRDWSEMSDAVRALYCILAGELCVVLGQTGAAEDRVAEFCISDKFGLSWQQSLALRVYFGGHAMLQDAINAYCADLKADERESHPAPFWVQEMEHAHFEDEDTAMGLLRLFAKVAPVSELFEPVIVSSSSVNSKLAWQFASTLQARKLVTLSDESMAKLTLEYATELEAASELVESAWVLLHLKNSAVRQQAVTRLLERNAGKITDPHIEGGNFDRLVNELQVPRSMVFAAKALYAQTTDDLYAQAYWLLQAAHFEEAHDVLCTSVGPQAVIEQDYAALANLVPQFPRRKPAGWEQGGQVYSEFVRLVTMRSAERYGDEGEKVLRLLKRSLAGIEGRQGRETPIEQRVAVIEMKRYAEELGRELSADSGMRGADAKKMDASSYGLGSRMLEDYRRALGVVA